MLPSNILSWMRKQAIRAMSNAVCRIKGKPLNPSPEGILSEVE
jgi:hypothetical protein